MAEHKARQSEKNGKKTDWKHALIMGVAALLLFTFGVNVGNGRIQLRNLAPTNDNAELPDNLDYAEVEQVYDTLKGTYDGKLTADQLLNGLKDGLAQAAGDEYTEYLNAQEAREFDDQLSGTFSGVGAELGKRNDVITIIAPLAGFPAEKAGLRAGDIIYKIDGEVAHDLTVGEAVNKIRGEKGTKVKLTVVRDAKELEFELTRAEINVPSVTSEILSGNVGYLKVSRFSEDTTKLAKDAANRFKQAGVKGVILDMRSNPGGLLDQAVSLSSLWLPSGKTVLQEKRGGEVVKTFESNGDAVLAGIKTIVLIDEGSASASEITAGALKDNGVATLLGQKTFGKGSVQQLEELVGGGILKVTVARWYTPGGKNIDKEGIEPDQKVERTDDDYSAGRDPQKDAAVAALVQSAR